MTFTPEPNRPIHFRSILVSACAAVLSFAFPASAQIAAPVVNISPVNSDLDNSNPNSASGGRVNGLAAHPSDPDIYFAASEWGGLYRTTDQGRNWDYVPGHVPQVTWDVEFDPSDPDTVIATSFYDGKTDPLSGISVSRDGGVTWSVPSTARPIASDCEVASAVNEPAAFGIAFDPANPTNVYVGTNCGLAVSTDSGATWDFLDPTPGTAGALNVYDVIVHNGGIVDLCGDDGHQRFTGGAFVAGAAEVGGRCSLAVSPDESDVLFMSLNLNIFESRDAGLSWPTTFLNPSPQGRIPFLVVNDRSGDAFDLWFGDVSLFRGACTTPADTTANTRRCPASNTWTNAQNGGHNDVGDLSFASGSTVDACPTIFSNDGGVYFNSRSGSNCHDPAWEQPDRSVTALWLWDMDGNSRTTPGEEGIYMGQQDSGGFGTIEAASATPDWNAPQCCDIFDVEAEDNRVIFTVCCWGGGRATRMFLDDEAMDGGTEIPNYPAGNLIAFRDADSLSNFGANQYALVTSAGIFFTNDIGANPINWQALGAGIPAGACGVYSSLRNDGVPVFTLRAGGCGLGQTGQLWQHVGATTTGNWTRVDRNGVSQFGAFGVNPTNPAHIIASDRSGPVPQMVRTFDTGATWTPLPQLDNMLTGHGDFVMLTQNGARPGDVGYPQASMVVINPAEPDMVAVAGQDSGVFLSLDGGNSWQLVTDPRTNNSLRPHVSRPLFGHFETFFNGRANLYVGARGRGAWRIAVNRQSFIAETDFDGDGTSDISIGSPWGIGTLAQNGSGLDALALKPNGSRFDGWLLNTSDNHMEITADLDGDGETEMVYSSPWGIGVLHLDGDNYGAHMLEPNGTRFGGWLLNTNDNKFGPSGDFDGDGRNEFLVSSPWGIGIFEFNGAGFDVPVMIQNGNRLGGWLLNTADNSFGPVGDFDDDGRDEIVVTSPWGLGVFDLQGSTLTAAALKPNGSRFDGWLLNTADNRFGPVGDLGGDARDDIVVRSPWGIGILNLSGSTFAGLMLKPNGTDFGGWRLDTGSDHSWAAGQFGSSSRDDLFVAGLNGVAVLRFDDAGQTFNATLTGSNGTRFGGWLLNTRDNRFGGFVDLTGDGLDDVLVSSPWGIGFLSQNGSTFANPVIAPNGTRFGGWLLNTGDNKFW